MERVYGENSAIHSQISETPRIGNLVEFHRPLAMKYNTITSFSGTCASKKTPLTGNFPTISQKSRDISSAFPLKKVALPLF